MIDPLDIFAKQQKLEADAIKAEEQFQRTTRKLFATATGKEWLRRAIRRTNFMGSVFSAEDGMSATTAAYRDGMRAMISEILNFMQPPTTNDDD